MNKIIFTSLIFLTSCSSIKEPVSSGVLSEAELKIVYNSDIQKWINWTKITINNICKDYNLAKINYINFYISDPEGSLVFEQNLGKGVISYVSGRYYHQVREIDLWIRNPHGTMFSFETYKLVVLHEMMHHYYYQNNMTSPEIHNELFEQEIKRLGWDTKY